MNIIILTSLRYFYQVELYSIDLINDNGYSALEIAHIREHISILNTCLYYDALLLKKKINQWMEAAGAC